MSVKRFGICQSCLPLVKAKEKDLLKSQVFVMDDQVLEVSHNATKAKYLKCYHCKTPKSAAFGFKPITIATAKEGGDLVLSMTKKTDHRLQNLAQWMTRESDRIGQEGCDYWVDEGVIYFTESDKGLSLSLNDQALSLAGLVNLLRG